MSHKQLSAIRPAAIRYQAVHRPRPICFKTCKLLYNEQKKRTCWQPKADLRVEGLLCPPVAGVQPPGKYCRGGRSCKLAC